MRYQGDIVIPRVFAKMMVLRFGETAFDWHRQLLPREEVEATDRELDRVYEEIPKQLWRVAKFLRLTEEKP